MKIEIYQAPFEQTAFGFEPTAEYERVWVQDFPLRAENGDIVGEATEATEILDYIFHNFQRVDPDFGPWPPEGYTGRSVSIGDVIVLDGWAPFSVEWVGFAAARGFEPRGLASAR